MLERHSPDEWRKTADALAASSITPSDATPASNVNKNGAPLLGDTRDLFRPKTPDIPAKPGVYKWRDGEGRVIYVGKAKNLRNRLTNYFQPLYLLHPRTQTMVLTARSLEWTVVGTELESLTLEYTWIKEFDPRFNVQFRDDKTYPYLAVSASERIPRVWVTRSRKRRDSRYFGPYAKVWELRQSLDKLLKTFPVRTCSTNVYHKAELTGRPCLLASIGKCSAPCVNRINAAEHRRMVEQLVGVMTGRLGKSHIARLTREMKEASAELEFEKAARLRDEIQMLSTVVEQNAVVFDDQVDADVFGFASDELEASVHAFYVRAGSIRGERNWSVERVEDIGDDELMADLIVQVYAEAGGDPSATGLRPSAQDDKSIVSNLAQDGNSAELRSSQDDKGTVPGFTQEDQREPQQLAQDDNTETTVELLGSRSGGGCRRMPTGGGTPTVTVETAREAIGSTQSLTARDAVARAQATRERNSRQEVTGRADLLAPIAPVPREVIVPIEPARRAELEDWLSGLRGGAVSIRVASRGDKRQLMERANENAAQALQRSKMSRISDMGARTQAMNDVADALGLSEAPLRIECYDISNTVGGAYQVASMVVFEDAIAKKGEYLRFAIRGKDGNGQADDLSALYETLTRRFRHGNIAGDSGEDMESEKRAATVMQDESSVVPSTPTVMLSEAKHLNGQGDPSTTGLRPSAQDDRGTVASFTQDDKDTVSSSAQDGSGVVQQNTDRRHFAYKPNLVVVDGGKPQAEAAARALADCGVTDVAVCGLAKRLEEVWLPDDDYPIILKRQSEGMYLLQRVRDESHRFAITYHRQTRRKGALRSALDEIPGIGLAHQKALLNHFGSLKAMRTANIEDFESVKGIGHAKAQALFDALHNKENEEAKS